MSYNITGFKVLKLENLSMPLSALQTPDCYGWVSAPVLIDPTLGKVRINAGEGFIEGVVAMGSQDIQISDIQIYGEGSGTLWEKILKPALNKSSGVLEVRLVWEGGDSLEYHVIRDGSLESMPA